MRQKSLIVQRVLPIISTPNNSSEDVISNPQEENKINDSSININDHQNEKSSSIIINESQVKNLLDELEVARDSKPTNSIITSATQILKEGEHQWLNSEVNFFSLKKYEINKKFLTSNIKFQVADFSLSSFLGQLESPMKISQRIQNEDNIEDNRLSSDVNIDNKIEKIKYIIY